MELEEDATLPEKINAILDGDLSPLQKVQHIVSLGYDEEEADVLVERYQSGRAQQVFYEELPKAEYAKRNS